MPTIQTLSATPLERIHLEPGRGSTTHVWLRKNIEQHQERLDGETFDVWAAEEVYIHMGTPITHEYVEAQFEELWARGSVRDQPVTLEELVSDLYLAVGELGAMVAGGDF